MFYWQWSIITIHQLLVLGTIKYIVSGSMKIKNWPASLKFLKTYFWGNFLFRYSIPAYMERLCTQGYMGHSFLNIFLIKHLWNNLPIFFRADSFYFYLGQINRPAREPETFFCLRYNDTSHMPRVKICILPSSILKFRT